MSAMKIAFSFYTLIISYVLMSCGTSEAAKNSSTKWAHTSSKTAMAILNSRIQYLDLKFKTDFSNIAVCIQGSQSFNNSSLLLETKLAYAAWLDASGQASESSWDQLDFELRPACNLKDKSYSSVVVVSEEAKITPDQEIEKTFAKNKVTCKRVGLSASCNTGSMTMGLGGSGSIGYQYFKPEVWESLSNRAPATVLLSPYVQWVSLETELKKTPALAALYSDLKNHADTVSFDELKAFHKELETRQLKVLDDGRLDGIVKTFLDSNEKSLVQNYVPVMPAFHVLLHEVGHQFGMDHADNPGLQSETGESLGASQKPGGQWSTALATMSYADEYLYLTPDDKAGIRDLATKSSELVRSHRGL